jgi:hypothetical protein
MSLRIAKHSDILRGDIHLAIVILDQIVEEVILSTHPVIQPIPISPHLVMLPNHISSLPPGQEGLRLAQAQWLDAAAMPVVELEQLLVRWNPRLKRTNPALLSSTCLSLLPYRSQHRC